MSKREKQKRERQVAKIKNSESYRKMLEMVYPYGLDDRKDADWEVIVLVDNDLNAMRAAWEVARIAAGVERADSAWFNAVDTVREGRFAEESCAFFSCAIGSLNP